MSIILKNSQYNFKRKVYFLMKKIVDQRSKQRELYENLLIALFINVPAVNIVIASIIPSLSNGVMAILYLVLICLFFFDYFLHYIKRTHVDTIASVMVVFTIIIEYVLTWIKIGNQLSILYLVVYVLLPLLIISQMDINGELVVKFCVLIPVIGVPFFQKVFQQTNKSISMGLSYAFLPAVIFAISYLLTCNRKNKLVTIAALVDLIYFVLIFLYGSRGVVLSACIAVFMMWLIRKKINHKYDPYFGIKIGCISVVTIIIVIFRWQIVFFLSNFFNGKGITVEFFDKIIRLQKLGGVDNGRSAINKVFLAEFVKKPLFGHGIKSFAYYTGIIYPHNFLYQMLFDIGIIGTLIIIVPIFTSAIKIFKRIGNYENSTVLIALICASVPGALFSGDLWLNPLLWLTFSLILRREYRR